MPLDNRANLDQFTIVVANKEQQGQHAKAGFEHWKKDMSWEQYEAVYKKERQSEWGRDGKLVTWALVRKHDPSGEIYAGCETYTRKGFVKHKGSNAVEDTHVYAIASVVTPREHMKNGYATRLLSLLHHQLSPSSFPPLSSSNESDDAHTGLHTPPATAASALPLLPTGIGSILWSDVGSAFYAKCSPTSGRKGWVVQDAQNQEIAWKLGNSPSSSSVDLPEGWQWLNLSDLPSVGQTLSKHARKKLENVDTTDRAVFIIDPASKGTLSFVPMKGMWNRPAPEGLDPEPVGVRFTSKVDSTVETIVLFSLSMVSIGPRLLITHIHNLSPDDLPTLLVLLDQLGATTGQKEGWVWDLREEDDASRKLREAWKAEREVVSVGRRQEIDGHLLGVAWYGPLNADELREGGELLDGQMWAWC
ncbi:hypothetical protein I317_07154 [Kwoniella heveanensis CBS 569]|nr:hypothetical protein I317_07154 [Kwoniella heveanensis CBS 569]